jgi:hypothetical protein
VGDRPDCTVADHGQSFKNAVQESAKKFQDYARRIGAESGPSGWAKLEPANLDPADAMKMAECLEPLILSTIQQCDAAEVGLQRDAEELAKAVSNRIQPILESGVWIAGDSGERLIFPTAPWMGTVLFKAAAFRAALREAIVQKIRRADPAGRECLVPEMPAAMRQPEIACREEAASAGQIAVAGGNEARELARARSRRLRATITSPSAARQMEAYLDANGIGQTEFAAKVGTTDRTLRAFRKTGKIRRDIFDQIAVAMGTTREILLK